MLRRSRPATSSPEGPTGIGNPHRDVALYPHGRNPPLERVVYACHTKKLQSQLIRDAGELPADRLLEDLPGDVRLRPEQLLVDGHLQEAKEAREPPAGARAGVVAARPPPEITFCNRSSTRPLRGALHGPVGVQIDDEEHPRALEAHLVRGSVQLLRHRADDPRPPDDDLLKEIDLDIEDLVRCPHGAIRLLGAWRGSSSSIPLPLHLPEPQQTAFNPRRTTWCSTRPTAVDGPVLEYCKQKLLPDFLLSEINEVLHRWNRAGQGYKFLKLRIPFSSSTKKPFKTSPPRSRPFRSRSSTAAQAVPAPLLRESLEEWLECVHGGGSARRPAGGPRAKCRTTRRPARRRGRRRRRGEGEEEGGAEGGEEEERRRRRPCLKSCL